MSKLSREQIKAIEDKIKIYRVGFLKCDDFKVTIREYRYKRQIRTNVYINDEINGEWLLNPEDHIESKFYMPYVRYIKKSPRSKKREKVEIGMRRYDFASVGQALRHINKVCDSVEVIEDS